MISHPYCVQLGPGGAAAVHVTAVSPDEQIQHGFLGWKCIFQVISSFYYFMPKVGKFGLNTPSCLELKGSLLCSREIRISAGQHDELLFVMPFSDLSKYCRLKSREPRRNQKFQQQVRSCWTEWSKKRHESSTTY